LLDGPSPTHDHPRGFQSLERVVSMPPCNQFGRRNWHRAQTSHIVDVIIHDVVFDALDIAEWDVIPPKAIHPDGNAILFSDEWTWLPLSVFYDRYCQHVQRTDMNVLSCWRTQLEIVAARDHDANEDDHLFGCVFDEAGD
jgi:hypothetical protein